MRGIKIVYLPCVATRRSEARVRGQITPPGGLPDGFVHAGLPGGKPHLGQRVGPVPKTHFIGTVELAAPYERRSLIRGDGGPEHLQVVPAPISATETIGQYAGIRPDRE